MLLITSKVCLGWWNEKERVGGTNHGATYLNSITAKQVGAHFQFYFFFNNKKFKIQTKNLKFKHFCSGSKSQLFNHIKKDLYKFDSGRQSAQQIR